MQIAENLKDIQQKIKKAALDAGREEDSVRLIAVSKTKPLELIHAAMRRDKWTLEKIACRN